jgi:hypothetical protein
MSWLLGMLVAAVPADAGTPPISPVLAIRPNTVAVSGGQALLTVRNTAEGVIPAGFQFRFVFDAPLGGVTVATATPIVRSALLVPADFAVAGSGTGEIAVNYIGAPKVFAAGETVSVRATFTLTPATETSVGVQFFSANGPVSGDTLAFVSFPSFPVDLTGFTVE